MFSCGWMDRWGQRCLIWFASLAFSYHFLILTRYNTHGYDCDCAFMLDLQCDMVKVHMNLILLFERERASHQKHGPYNAVIYHPISLVSLLPCRDE